MGPQATPHRHCGRHYGSVEKEETQVGNECGSFSRFENARARKEKNYKKGKNDFTRLGCPLCIWRSTADVKCTETEEVNLLLLVILLAPVSHFRDAALLKWWNLKRKV